jgi:hypothetical protein
VAEVRLYPITTTFIGLITADLGLLAEQMRACLGLDAPRPRDTRV